MRLDGVPVNRLARDRIAGELVAAALGVGLLFWAYAADRVWFDRHALEYYCARSRATLRGELALRSSAAALGTAWLVFGGAWLGRKFAQKGAVAIARVGLVMVAVVLLSLVCSDLILRIQLGSREDADDPHLPPMLLDEHGNTRLAPSESRAVVLGTRTVHYAVNREGNRACRADDLPDPSRPTILFAGESIAMGWGVACDAAYPELVGAALGVQSVNLAAPGWGSDRAYLRTLETLPRFAHPLAVVVLVAPIQLGRNVSRERRRLSMGDDGKLRSVDPLPLFGTSPLRRLAERMVSLHSDEAIPLTRAILRATVEADEAHGAKTLFVLTNHGPPCMTDERESSWLERALFEGVDAPHVRVDLGPGATIEGDGHPDEAGHRRIAASVVEELRKMLPNGAADPGVVW